MKNIKSIGYLDCIIDGKTVRLKTVKGYQCDTVLRYVKNNELFEGVMQSRWKNLEFITIYKKLSSELYTEIKNFTKYEVM